MIRAAPSVGADSAYERLLRLAFEAEDLAPSHRALVQEVLEACSTTVEELQTVVEELHLQNEELLATRAGLEAEHRRYLDLFEGAPDGYLVTNVGGLIQDANRAAVEMLATPKHELVDTPLILYVEAGDRDLLHAHLDRLTEQGRAEPGEIEWEMCLQPQQQPSFPAACSLAPVYDAGGNPMSLRWLVRDLRASRRAEERERLLAQAERDRRAIRDLADRLAREQAILETTMEHAHAGLAYLDVNCRLLRFNEACAHLLNGGSGEPIAGNPLDLLPSGRVICQQVIASGQPIYFKGQVLALPNQPEDQVKYWDWALVPVKDSSGRGQGAVLSLVDVTERQRTEFRLQRFVAELRKSNELLEQFASVASHDLRTPLQSVLNYLELLEEQDRSAWSQRSNQYLEGARRSAHRMKLMIGGLLDLARVSSRSGCTLAPVDLARVLAWVLDNLQAEIEQSGATVTHDHLPTVLGDEVQLVQVFQNLVANALKFRGDEPPRVHVSARHAPQPPGAKGEGEVWILAVQDNGIGFDPAEADRLFEPFQRLHPERGDSGTGLGLAICNRIVEHHGGRMWSESQPGDGSTFYVSLLA